MVSLDGLGFPFFSLLCQLKAGKELLINRTSSFIPNFQRLHPEHLRETMYAASIKLPLHFFFPYSYPISNLSTTIAPISRFREIVKDETVSLPDKF